MVENTNRLGNSTVKLNVRRDAPPKPNPVRKLSNITSRFLNLAKQKGMILNRAYSGRLLEVDSYLLHKIDAARHLKLPRDLHGLAKQTFLKGTGKQLWSLIKSSKNLTEALAARQKGDANLIADILTMIHQNS